MREFRFDPNNTYLAAATFGPASMAMLDFLKERAINPVVLFVNYDHSEITEVAERELKQYCESKNLTLEILDGSTVDQTGRDEDYTKWARETRYDFFEKMYEKYDAAALCLAHTEDDIIESYLLTKRYGKKAAIEGLNPISVVRGMLVICPLINFSNTDIYERLHLRNVPYSEEVRIAETSSTRSRIRNDYVAHLNELERGQILDAMAKEKADQISFADAITSKAEEEPNLDIRSIMALSFDDFAEAVVSFVSGRAGRPLKVSPAKLKQIREMCLAKTENMTLKIEGDIYICKEYDELTVDLDGLDMPYSYTLEKPCKFECSAFELDFTGGAEDRNIHEDDYPITIRSVLPQDVSLFGGYLNPVKKMLAAAGCSQRLIHIWPVFLNKDGKIIYVPRYKKGFSEYHTSKLVLHVFDEER